MYHYGGTGLKNVYLENGYEERETTRGRSRTVRDIEGLHAAIGRWLCLMQPKLSGSEFGFLRKQMRLTQPGLAAILGNDAQSVAKWEKTANLPGWANRIIRPIYFDLMNLPQESCVRLMRFGAVGDRDEKDILCHHFEAGWKVMFAQ